MVTIEELKKENKRLREMQVKIKAMQKDNADRRRLAMENKRLARNIKFDKSIGTAKRAAKITKTVGKASGKILAKTGRGAFKGLQKYAKFLDEQEKKQRSVNRKLKSVKKSKRRR